MNFQLYRGNLHTVPDVPRRWSIAKPSIPLAVFKKAIAKRCEALAEQDARNERLCDEHVKEERPENDTDEHDRKRKREKSEASGMSMEVDEDVVCGSEKKPRKCVDADSVMIEDTAVNGADVKVDGRACEPFSLPNEPDTTVRGEGEDVDMAGVDAENAVACEDMEKDSERLEAPRTPAPKDEDCTKSSDRIQSKGLDGCSHNEDPPSIEKRRAEIQEQLKQLQETKHQLVQILKQVLVSEEEAKRRSQGISQCSAPCVTTGIADLSVDQKVGSDLQTAELEEGELEYTRNSIPLGGVTSSHVSHFSDVHPQIMNTTIPGRHFSYQPSRKV
ncbi:hypothetical protein KP509_27G030600 [Ceratopteris richardii]|uniref:Uncharacterized protein n=1 Tax=Ceratopteris richardii TaxID=49495 RepID=A0A8T2RGW4_CERRI|nr:hypothetical protein KP509_27G030600 [Ceratopteris richardii]